VKEQMVENEMANDPLVDRAMEIILHAGDARMAYKKALDHLINGRLKESDEILKAAEKEITLAHQVQTDCIHGAVRGDVFEYNVLFAHAQDTLMTIYSEITLVKQLAVMYKQLDERLKKLEDK